MSIMRPRTATTTVLAAALLAGCGSSAGEEPSGGDSSPSSTIRSTAPTPTPTPTPTTSASPPSRSAVVVTGQVTSSRSRAGLSGVTVAAYPGDDAGMTDDTFPIAMVLSGPNGSFSLPVELGAERTIVVCAYPDDGKLIGQCADGLGFIDGGVIPADARQFPLTAGARYRTRLVLTPAPPIPTPSTT